jgi:ABC-type multidrug transport system ATPase subunit
MQIIRITGLTKRFGKKLIFRDVNAEFENGVHGISGPNGSGKSTLLKCVAGLLKPTSGVVNVAIAGRELDAPERLIMMAFSGPYINMYAELTVYENLQFLCRLLGKNDAGIPMLLEKLGIHLLAGQAAGSLSSGQLQRLRLASALLKDAPILLLDEPGTNLDSDGQLLVESIVDEYRSAGRLVLLASNQASELGFCDTILSVSNYKLMEKTIKNELQ